MKTRETHLKVKVLHLSEESRIIRREAERSNDIQEKASLQQHRLQVVRPASRVAHLAYAAVKGIPYVDLEAKVHDTYTAWECVTRAVKDAKRFATEREWGEFWKDYKERYDREMDRIDQWHKDAIAHLEAQRK